MFSLLSFLGGTTFRLLFGELMAFLNRREDHKLEIEKLELQEKLDQANFDRQQSALRLQTELGIKLETVKVEGRLSELDAEAFNKAVEGTINVKTGWSFVDAWNSAIRPGIATWGIIMLTGAEFGLFALSEQVSMIAAAGIGIFLGARDLYKRGK